MDFKKLCLFLKKNRFKNKSILRFEPLLRESYSNLNIKIEKLKTGSITFSFKTLFFANIAINNWFEIEYKSQISADKEKRSFERGFETLTLKWDFQSMVLALMSLLILISYINYLLIYVRTLLFISENIEVLYSQVLLSTFELLLPDSYYLWSSLKIFLTTPSIVTNILSIL